MSNPCRLDDTTQNKIAYAIGYEKGKLDVINKIKEYINTHRYANEDLLEYLKWLKE